MTKTALILLQIAAATTLFVGNAEASARKNSSWCGRLVGAVALPPDAEIPEIADRLHGIWQQTNNYLTRFKPMKENGKPVTDIDDYIRRHDIPVRFRAYRFNHTTKSYEEDIKVITNKYLAPNNAEENVEGAMDYTLALHDILNRAPVTNVRHAKELIWWALQQIHFAWRLRNISWASYQSVDIRQTSIDNQYTNFLPLMRLAFDKPETLTPALRTAFGEIYEEFYAKRFGPYADVSIADAYARITGARGHKPNFETEADQRRFFDSKIMNRISGEIDVSNGGIQRFLAQHFPTLEGRPSSSFRIVAPPTAPGSGASVHLLFSESELIAVLKVQSGPKGLDEVISTIAGAAVVGAIENGAGPARVIDFGKIGENTYFILQEAAKESEFERLLRNGVFSAEAERAAEAVAKALAGLHETGNETPSKEDKRIFQGNAYYDVGIMRREVDRQDGTFPVSLAGGDLPPYMADTLRQRLHNIATDYEMVVESTPELLRQTHTHGDFHGGNIFTGELSSTFIDYGGVTWSFGSRHGTGTGDPGNDIGRVLGHIAVEAIKQNRTVEELRRAHWKFMNHYNENMPAMTSEEYAALQKSIQFYMARFMLINAGDFEGIKLSPRPGETMPQLRARYFSMWWALLDSK